MDDLDARIRELVARAVAEAPGAPPLDEPALRVVDRPRSSTRWIAGGAAGLSVAAAVVALFWVAANQVTDEAVTPLETTPSVATSPTSTDVPVPTDPVTSDPVTTQPATVDPATSLATTTMVPTTTTEPAAPSTGEFLNVGPEGVWAYETGSGGGSGGTITDEPMAVAFRAPDGRVFMQRSSEHRGDPDADTTILVAVPGSTELIGQPMPSPELDLAPKRLHDVAVVDGEVILLIEAGPGLCATPESCEGSVWALAADSGRLSLILTQNMWESGFGRLHLAETGVIVGEAFSEASSAPFSAALPGADAGPIDFEQFGLDATYYDCSTCPSAYSIDRSGTKVAWLEWSPDAFVVAVAAVDGTEVERFPLVDERTDYNGDGFAPNPWLEIADANGRVLFVNSQTATWTDPVAPFVIDLDRASLGTTGLAPGTVVTAG